MTERYYTVLEAYGREVGQPALMSKFDATSVTLLNITQLFYDVYFKISVPVYTTPRILYLEDIPLDDQIREITLQEWLDEIGNKTIELTTEVPNHIQGNVYSWDVDSYGFSIKPTKLGANINARINDEDKEDLLLSKSGMDYDYMFNHSLVAVNGLFHFTDKSTNGIYIEDGNKTRLKNPDHTHVNILDFTQVGSVRCKKITEDMLRRANEDEPMYNCIYLDVGEDTTGKTVGIVIGGYLHLLDNTYKFISNRIMKIRFTNIRYESLYYQMKKLIDVSDLPITDFGDNRVLGFELYHDTTIKKLFTLSQSFLVFIDNPYMNIKEIPIGSTNIPHRYETAIKPVYPLRIGEGRYVSYKAIKNYDKWSIATENNIVPLQVRYQAPQDKFETLHDAIYPINGEVYATANFVIITSERDIKTVLLDEYFDEMGRDMGDVGDILKKGNIIYKRLGKTNEFYPIKLVDIDLEDKYFEIKESLYCE